MNVLIIAAHPDDEIIGVGGTIAKHIQLGDEVSVVILGDGKTSRQSMYVKNSTSLMKMSHYETEKAVKLLGIKSVYFHDLPDNRFDSLNLLDIVKVIEGYIESLHPEVMYTHFGGDINIDHSVTFRAVMTATRLLPGCSVKWVFAYETLSSTEWNYEFISAFRPNYFVDITNQLELKIEAMKQYNSELREFPHPRSLEAIRCNARTWGGRSGFKAAEPFVLVRGVW